MSVTEEAGAGEAVARPRAAVLRDQQEARRAEMWALRLQGLSTRQIAAAMGLHHGTVARRLNAIREEVRRERAASVEAWRAERVAAHEQILAAALAAYEASCSVSRTVMSSGRASVTPVGQVVKLPDEVVTHSPAANPFHLQVALRALKGIRELEGLDVARDELTVRLEPVKLYAGVDLEEV